MTSMEEEKWVYWRNKAKQLEEENKQLKMQLQNTSAQRDEFHRGARENANRIGELEKENEQLKEILKDITIQLDANHTMNTYQMVIPINRVIYNELKRRLKETSFNEELRRFLDD